MLKEDISGFGFRQKGLFAYILVPGAESVGTLASSKIRQLLVDEKSVRKILDLHRNKKSLA